MCLAERFRVSCLPSVAAVADRWDATHVVSLIDPELPDEMVPQINAREHIVARLRDQETPALTIGFPSIVKSLFETVRPAVERPDSRILIHCHAGVSRSTAFAYALMAHVTGEGEERAAFSALMQIVNKPWPNRRVIEILDNHLERKGALLEPLDEMRAQFPRRISAWRRFNARRAVAQEIMGRYER